MNTITTVEMNDNWAVGDRLTFSDGLVAIVIMVNNNVAVFEYTRWSKIRLWFRARWHRLMGRWA